MNDCERLSERMPEVNLGRSSWTPAEAAHLRSCAECRAEWRLVTAAAALDAPGSLALDASAIAAAVRRRLAAERRARTRRIRVVVLTGAAAAATLLAVVWPDRTPGGDPAPTIVADAEAILPLPELEGLTSRQLDTLLHSIDRPFAGTSTLEATTLGGHEDGELEQALASWEG